MVSLTSGSVNDFVIGVSRMVESRLVLGSLYLICEHFQYICDIKMAQIWETSSCLSNLILAE